MNNPSAIVLAAGTSSRMGAPNKLLLNFGGVALVRHVVMRIIAAGPFETIVVTGHQEKEIRDALAGLDVLFVHNPDFEQGMTSSIQAGAKLAGGTGLMVCLSDMYAVSASQYAQLMLFFLDKLKDDTKSICLPFYQGERGNPVIFSAAYRNEILAHTEPEGCKRIIQEHADHLYKFQFESAEILRDIDTPNDYQTAKNNPA